MSFLNRWRAIDWIRLAITVLILMGAAGCGGSSRDDRPTGKVAGVVTLNGLPLSEGIVLFEDSARGIGVTANVFDGEFRMEGVPTGEYRVAIQPPPPDAPLDNATPTEPIEPIPAKYQKPAESGLTQSVDVGENNTEFALEGE